MRAHLLPPWVLIISGYLDYENENSDNRIRGERHFVRISQSRQENRIGVRYLGKRRLWWLYSTALDLQWHKFNVAEYSFQKEKRKKKTRASAFQFSKWRKKRPLLAFLSSRVCRLAQNSLDIIHFAMLIAYEINFISYISDCRCSNCISIPLNYAPLIKIRIPSSIRENTAEYSYK